MDRYPYRGGRCLLIPKRRGDGWQVDMEIDGEFIDAIYWNAQPSSKEEVTQEATRSADVIIRSRDK